VVHVAEADRLIRLSVQTVDAIPLVAVVALDAVQHADRGIVTDGAEQVIASDGPGADVRATDDAAWHADTAGVQRRPVQFFRLQFVGSRGGDGTDRVYGDLPDEAKARHPDLQAAWQTPEDAHTRPRR